MAIEAFLFDLDGTLVDSSRDLAAAVNRLRRQIGLPELPAATVLSYVGDGATNLLRRALPDGMFNQRILQQFMDIYAADICVYSYIYPGVENFLQRHYHKPLAVVSNKPLRLAEALLEALKLRHYFTVVVGGDSLPHKKPHPAPLLYAADTINVMACNCVMIGDHHTDLRGAAAAGCPSCFCRYGFGVSDGVAATWQVDSADELEKLFP